MVIKKYKVAIIGCGRLGQLYAEAYSIYPDTEIVAIAEYNSERRKAVGERFGVKALYKDAEDLLNDIIPDIAAIVTPTKFYKEAVIKCVEAGVKAISTDKPIAAKLSDADEIVSICESKGVILAGGALFRALGKNQDIARYINEGVYGEVRGAALHCWGVEISGGGSQHISLLRLFTNSEIEEVMSWGTHVDLVDLVDAGTMAIKDIAKRDHLYQMANSALNQKEDQGIIISGYLKMSSGIQTNIFGTPTPFRGVDVWTDTSLIRWDWNDPQIYQGFDKNGKRILKDEKFSENNWDNFGFGYLGGAIRSLIDSIETGAKLWISGHDLRQALEVAIATTLSAKLGNVPVKLPLKDRSLSLYPRPYRWLGGDETGRYQTAEEVTKQNSKNN